MGRAAKRKAEPKLECPAVLGGRWKCILYGPHEGHAYLTDLVEIPPPTAPETEEKEQRGDSVRDTDG